MGFLLTSSDGTVGLSRQRATKRLARLNALFASGEDSFSALKMNVKSCSLVSRRWRLIPRFLLLVLVVTIFSRNNVGTLRTIVEGVSMYPTFLPNATSVRAGLSTPKCNAVMW